MMLPEGSAAPRRGTTAAERRAQDAGPNAARVRHAKAIDAQTRHAEFLQQEGFELAEMERKVQDAASKMQAYYRGFITRKMHIPKQRKQKIVLEQFGLANIFEQYCKIQCRELRKDELAYQQALAKQNRRSSLSSRWEGGCSG